MVTLFSRFRRATVSAFVLLSTLFGLCHGQANASRSQPSVLATQPVIRSYFYMGGGYAGEAGKEVMQGQMYVEQLTPARITQKYPLVMFHGAAQTGTNWLQTPDSRPGWADYFLSQGYVVYLVDQPARGRSAWHPGLDGALANFPVPAIEKLFTASATLGNWPQAKQHTQWPGSGKRGDPVFDAFYATQVEYLASNAETQRRVQAAGAALLDRIGPAILLTHSQAGAFGWLIADARPQAVRGIVAVEPLGPPAQNAVSNEQKARPWGPTDIPLNYDPPVGLAGNLALEQEEQPDSPTLARCFRQREPARQLPNLAGIPILIAVGEASYHAVYDHCTAKYLTQAGATITFWRLENLGIKGNGHMMMLEKNNLDIASWLQQWMQANVR
ncbi:alpha/beta hydrolase [Cupriavidus basilensis]|uniref:Alpha/beta hydrolase n=1 Tax=Cupriavidus basilensis TaxID=68895 RepID=A0ABT6ANK1_9BURK|nr:alpha/beta hydrolase [Cupriavidus basilensis]MDF3834183.1 alpha/beta hydrolase [Cupriavidus basilensis]